MKRQKERYKIQAEDENDAPASHEYGSRAPNNRYNDNIGVDYDATGDKNFDNKSITNDESDSGCDFDGAGDRSCLNNKFHPKGNLLHWLSDPYSERTNNGRIEEDRFENSSTSHRVGNGEGDIAAESFDMCQNFPRGQKAELLNNKDEKGCDLSDEKEDNPNSPNHIQNSSNEMEINQYSRNVTVKKANKLLKSMQRSVSKRMMIGLTSIYRKVRYTLTSYDRMKNDLNGKNALPSHSSLRQFVFPYLMTNNFVQSRIEYFSCKLGAQSNDETDHEALTQRCTLVLPEPGRRWIL